MGVAAFTVRPVVPMGYVTGMPYVAALAVARSLGARLRWPYEVVTEGGMPLARVRVRAGYDEQGLFVTCEIAPSGERGLDAAALEAAVRTGVGAWAADVSAGRALAGPLAPILGDYFDALLGMGEEVEVVRAGSVLAHGTLVGMDVWGRATVRTRDGARDQEVELAPEQAQLR